MSEMMPSISPWAHHLEVVVLNDADVDLRARLGWCRHPIEAYRAYATPNYLAESSRATLGRMQQFVQTSQKQVYLLFE